MPRPQLSEEAEREEAEGRERLRSIDAKLRELRSRRQHLIDEVHRLSDEQRALADARAPKQANVEEVNARHREIGRELAQLRVDRDAARRRLEEAVVAARLAEPDTPQARPARPDQIRREMADLEKRQQTQALPLADENALIARLRLLRRQLDEAEREREGWATRENQLRGLHDAVRARRTELGEASAKIDRLRVERERAMQSMRAQLVDLGHLVAALRAAAAARREAMARAEETSRQIFGLEREGDRLLQDSRSRRHEARRAVVDYNRSVRQAVSGETAYDRAADQQLQELLKRGRVTLAG